MGYQIDVAFDMRIVGSMTNLYDMFVKKALRYLEDVFVARDHLNSRGCLYLFLELDLKQRA